MGRSRGGRSTKIHALTDRQCRPIAFLLTGDQVADCEAAKKLREQLPPTPWVLHGDKGYDTNPIRQRVEANGTMPSIPPMVTGSGRVATRLCFIGLATRLNGCSAASRTSAASRHAMIGSPPLSAIRYASEL